MRKGATPVVFVVGPITGRPADTLGLVVKPRAHAAPCDGPRARRAARANRRDDPRHTRTDIAHTACRESPYTPVGCSRVAPPVSRQPPHASAGRQRLTSSDRTRIRSISSLRSGFCARRTGQIDLEAVQLQYEELLTSMVHGSDRSASARLTPTNPCAAPAGGCRRGLRTGRRASSVRCAAHP